VSQLLREIEAIIGSEGPIGIDRYMALALGHPVHGYYTTRDPLGAAGDFTTAPEISQMFGELLGLWAVAVWDAMGRPSPCRLVELGPGRGTLMADALRAAGRVPEFEAACSVHLVETSPALRARQRAALEGRDVSWHADVEEVPEGPMILLANEFLDALPIRQFVRTEAGWHERLVGLGSEGGLAFGLAPHPAAGLDGAAGRPGDIIETCPAAQALVAGLARRLVAAGGAALFIDYGPATDGPGDSLQAVRRHGFADPLAEPGQADLTAHVRFGALARVAARSGATAHGPIGQGAFLEALGIRARAAALSRGRDEATQAALASALARLTGPEAMGELFKAFAIAAPKLGPLPGLPAGDAEAHRG
jgi:SAM-dependent MidA family methyltransferase